MRYALALASALMSCPVLAQSLTVPPQAVDTSQFTTTAQLNAAIAAANAASAAAASAQAAAASLLPTKQTAIPTTGPGAGLCRDTIVPGNLITMGGVTGTVGTCARIMQCGTSATYVVEQMNVGGGC